jgi:methionyl aminopeptidase
MKATEAITDEAVEKWRKAGKVTARARELAASLVVPGARLEEVAEKVEGYIRAQGALPAFPLNLSADHWAAHYTPEIDDTMVFSAGQIVKVDIGAAVDGYPADSATTVEVGGSRRYGDLTRATKEAVAAGIETIGPDIPLTKVGEAIERTIGAYGLRPIQNLTGHLIQRNELHAGKSVPNVGTRKGDTARVGEVFAVEPFATSGEGEVVNGEPGNIYRFQGRRKVKDPDAQKLMVALEKEHPSLPFAARWCKGLCETPKRSVKLLRSAGVLYAYPVLVEKGRGPVSQHEHTVLITKSGAVQFT